MGCPAPKIAMNGGGASLMKNPKLAGEIVKAVSNAVDIPVTVKIRKGWDDESITAVELAQIAEKTVRRQLPFTEEQECKCIRARLTMT